MTQITNLSIDEIATSIQLFRDEAKMRASIGAADEYLRQVLVEALGEPKASICWTRFLPAMTTRASKA